MDSLGAPKFRILAEDLEKAIRSGKWHGEAKLPAVRVLAQEYGVSLATVSRALEVLHGKGIISPNSRSGTYLTQERSHADTEQEHWAACFRITPGAWQRGSMAIVGGAFNDFATHNRIRLDFEAIPSSLQMSDAAMALLVRRAKQTGVKGLFFLPSRISETLMHEDERLLAHCRNIGLPVVLIERNLRGDARPLQWDLVCPDDFDGGYRCAMHLLESGRKHLAFIRGAPVSSHNDMLAGFLAAHYHGRNRGLIRDDAAFPPVLEYPEGAASKDAYHELCDQILRLGVDGLVCYQDRVVIGLAIELLSRGKRIPRDVALVGFDDQPMGQEFTLGVTTYAFPGPELAARAMQVMRERAKNLAAPPIKVLVPSQLIIRESSAQLSSRNGRK